MLKRLANRGFFGCLGVVGGFMQPQGRGQLIRNILDRETLTAAPPAGGAEGSRSIALIPGFAGQEVGVSYSYIERPHLRGGLPILNLVNASVDLTDQ
jgi:hypothetical protein